MTWISHGCTCVPNPEPPSHLPPHPIPQGRPSALALSTLDRTSFTALFNPLSKEWIIGHPLLYPLVSPLLEVSCSLMAWIIISTQNTSKCKYSAFLSKRDFPGGSDGKASAYNTGELGSSPGSGRSPGEENGNCPIPVLLPGKSHGWRNLADYSPWSHKESDTTEQLHFLSSFLSKCQPSTSTCLLCITIGISHGYYVHFSSGLLWQTYEKKSFYFQASKKLLCCV